MTRSYITSTGCLLTGFLLFFLSAALCLADDTEFPVVPVEFTECDQAYPTPADAECARLQVPQNPAVPAGQTLSLNIMRVPAVNRTQADPVFIIVGGPGGAAVRSAPQYLSFFRGLQKNRDIVFVDQRGTGESNGLACAWEDTPFSRLNDRQRQQQALGLVKQCIEALDADLELYTTPYAVSDLEQVRIRLGYPHINLWGVSYGTRVILEFMRQYPGSVRAAVLDGVAPVSIQLPRFAEQDGSRALGLIFDQCERSTPCRESYGNLREDWLNLLNALSAKPQTVTLSHPRSQEKIPTHVSAVTLSSWVRLALYSRELAPLLPRAIHQATQNDFSVLGGIGLLAMDDIEQHMSQGMQMTVLCAEDQQYAPAGFTAEAEAAREKLLWLDKPETFAQLCDYLPKGHIPKTYFSPVKSGVPTLLLSGNYDPITPPRWAERVAQHLSHSRHILVPGGHHGVTMQGCVARLVQQFIEDGSATAINSECIETIQPRPFFIDAAGPAMTAPPSDAGDQL